MAVYRRGSETYHYEFQLNGHRFRGTTEETTRAAAKRVEAQKRVDAEKGIKPGKNRDFTLAAAAEKYYEEIAAAQRSADTTDGQLENLIRIIGGKTMLSQINPAIRGCV